MGNFVTDTWNALVGKPQSWYTNVSSIQNQLSLVLAGITAIGSDIWDTAAVAQGPTQDGGSVTGLDDYATCVAAINAAMKSIIVTTSYLPDDPTIAAAQATATNYNGQLGYVESVAPELSDVVTADQQQVSAMLPGPMSAPAVAGQTAFAQALSDRAAALGQGLFDFATYLPWIIGGVFGLWALSKMGGRP